MNILHIANLGRNNKIGGLGIAVLQLAEAQRKCGSESYICSFSNHESIINNKDCYFTPNKDTFIYVLKNKKPDIAIINGIYEKEDIWVWKCLKKYRIPYLIVFHGSASADNAKKGWLKKKVANFIFFNKIIANAEGVIYLNKSELKKSVFRKVNDKYSIIPNGVNYPDSVIKAKGDDYVNIVFMSRLDYYGKGLDVLLPAISRLYNEGWQNYLKFTFYGNSYDNTYKKLQQYGSFVTYKGFVAGDRKNKAFEDASINILPSRSEGMPMTILDSLAFGRPCIVTRMTNMADLIEENSCGWIVELNEEALYSTIVNAVKELRECPDKYFNNCRKTACLFSWNEIAKKSISIYNRYLTNRK